MSEIPTIQLPSMRIASFHGYGTHPEDLAMGKLIEWAKPKGYFGEKLTRRVFSFNNPNPSPDSPNYGYDFWIELDADEEVEPDVQVVDFGGGAYAVALCEVLGNPEDAIPNGWMQLYERCQKAGLLMGEHQWLEEHLTVPEFGNNFKLNLLLPVVL